MTKHKEGYVAECEPPQLSRKWKPGQVWGCECGNLFRVTMTNSHGESFILWEPCQGASVGNSQ